MQNGLLCIKWEYTEENLKWRICIPSLLLPSTLWHIEDAHVSGHLGITKTMSRAKVCPFYLIKMWVSVEEYVRERDTCGEANDPKGNKRDKRCKNIKSEQILRECVEEYVRAYDTCGEANDPQRKKRQALQEYKVGARFERTVYCDRYSWAISRDNT